MVIKTNSLTDQYGLLPVNHDLYRREKVYLSGVPETQLEVTYERILKLHNHLDKIRNTAIRQRRNDASIALTYQRSALTEVLRIIFQEILLDRGADEKTIQQKEDNRKWENLRQR